MLCEIEKEENVRQNQGIPLNHSHKFGDKQWSYNKKLADEAGFGQLIKPVIQRTYDRAGERRVTHPANYKYDRVQVIDNEKFEYFNDFFCDDKIKD